MLTGTGPANFLERAQGALLSQPDGVLSHWSAAQLWGLPVPRQLLQKQMSVCLPVSNARRQRAGLALRRVRLRATEQTVHGGLPVTTVPRTLLDISRTSPDRAAAVAAGDAALASGLCTAEEASAALRAGIRTPGIRLARTTVPLLDGRSRSPQESRVRLILHDAGLPAPCPNWPLFGESGSLIAIGDLVYLRWLTWLEYDGFAAHTQRRTFREDPARERRIRARGFDVIRLVDTDVHHPAVLVGLVRRTLRDAPRRIAALPPDLSPEVRTAQRLLAALARQVHAAGPHQP